MPEKPLCILVDMDGTITDFESGFLDLWRARFPRRPFVELNQRQTFYVSEDYPPEYKTDINTIIYHEAGFFANLSPINGAIEALTKMEKLGHQVFICSAPRWTKSVHEKSQWIGRHLGENWVNRLILTRDKSIVRGDILIDDRPEMTTSRPPLWEQVLFDQPYNRHLIDKRRLNWQNYREVLGI